jgi:hypothetical protein
VRKAAVDARHDAPTRPPAPPAHRWQSDEELFGPLGDREAPQAAEDRSLSDRPTKEAAATAHPMRNAPLAPPPPRLPTLGPEPEFSFGLKPDVLPAEPLSEDPAASTDVMTRPLAPEADLAWDHRGGEDFAQTAFDERERARPRQAAPAVAAARPAAPAPPDPRRDLQDRFALGNFSGALVIAEAMLADAPDDAEVRRIAEECRAKLQQRYLSRLGAVTQVPVMAVPRSELKWLSLDHRAGFVLSLVDGASNVEDLIDVSGMPPLEVLRTLFELLSQRVIELKPPRH